LPHYASLKVAEQFSVLSALAPGRIDLGVGRAPGSDQRTAQLLNPDRYASDHFGQQILEIKTWLNAQTMPVGHLGHGVFAYPRVQVAPTIWVLGSSDYGAQLAAHLGLPYAFAHFITDGQGAQQALMLYRDGFVSQDAKAKPQALMCVWALVAPTHEQALHQFASRAKWKMDRQKGVIGPLLSPDEALAGMSTVELQQFEAMCERAIIGDAQGVREKILRLCAEHDLDELVIITWAHDPRVQQTSYELLAKAFELDAKTSTVL
jgi:luciferase family oxidoreductase group 1